MQIEETINNDFTEKKGRRRKKQLYNTILQQMEFYFSDSNLSKDRYLSQLISEDPYVPLLQFLTFNKIRRITNDIEDIRKAITKSEILELSEDQEKVKRKTSMKIKENVDECTIYVEKIGSEVNHEFLSNLFSEFGTVTYVSIPKYRHNQLNKGFAFVEFEHEEEAKSALDYFENIGSKMSSNINPEDLCSVVSFLKESQSMNDNEEIGVDEPDANCRKRKHSDDDELSVSKKIKNEENLSVENSKLCEGEGKKKKKKELKKKNLIKEQGLQILSKKEWKKMRNGYLNIQRKKMKEVKGYLSRSKFSKNEKNRLDLEKVSIPKNENGKMERLPGTIVKVTLLESNQSDKKIKMDIKNAAKDVKYIDVPSPFGSKDIYVRFSTIEAAEKFCSDEFKGDKYILKGSEEDDYWTKIESDRAKKFEKSNKKQRGRDKLLKKAEKYLAKHTRFEEND